jgi:hypothetical protein
MSALVIPQVRSSGQSALLWRLVLAVWIAVGFAVTIRVLLRPDSHTIFPILVGGSVHWWADEPMYADYYPLDYYRYTPGFSVAVTPLALLGTRVGGVCWTWLSLAVYGLGLWRFQRDVLPGRWTNARQAAFLLLALLGGLRGLWNGQSNALVMGLLLLGAAALVRGRDWWAALALGGAVAIKLTPLAPVLLLAVVLPRRLLGRLAVVLTAAALLPFLTRPPEVVCWQYRDLVAQAETLSSKRWPGFRDAWTVWQVVEHEVSSTPGEVDVCLPLRSPVYRAGQLAGAFLTFLWCLRLPRRSVSGAELVNLTLAAGLTWLLLLGPATEHSTYVLIAPVLCWALIQRDLWPAGWRRWLLVVAAFFILVLGWGAVAIPIAGEAWGLLPLPVGCALFALWLTGAVRTCKLRPDRETYPLLRGLRAGESMVRLERAEAGSRTTE